MHVAIVGFETEGRSALHYWQNLGADITVCDHDPAKAIPAGIASQLGLQYLHDLDRFDLVVRSAGVNPSIILDENPNIRDKMTTVIDEFLRVCPTKNVIGITGTKGKGTTCTLTAKMLEAAGKQVFLGGNIGLSPFDFLDKLTPDSWVVLELSSFQLIDLRRSPRIAVCLMVVPEHLNWHPDLADYTQAKSHLFAHQAVDDIAIYFADNRLSRQIANHSSGKKITYYAPPGAYVEDGAIMIDNHAICKADDLKMLGQHNWQNACAAVTAVWQVVQAPDAFRDVLTSFSGLPHHLEQVRKLDGITYYDDSFGTTPETAIVALQAFAEPKVVILGGSSKNATYDELVQAVLGNNVRHVIAIGDTGPVITSKLQAAGFTTISPGGTTMNDIVNAARSVAQPGDIVLLSTGCASFGLFNNYKDRGEQFKQVVTNL